MLNFSVHIISLQRMSCHSCCRYYLCLVVESIISISTQIHTTNQNGVVTVQDWESIFQTPLPSPKYVFVSSLNVIAVLLTHSIHEREGKDYLGALAVIYVIQFVQCFRDSTLTS
mmetsp:Transcript_16100/g.23887  ORF Transcript_16100/g.23887 Transcript_16100/m.23887 type:complete len:114 (-) Transcript_16100:489-830(-)